MEWGSGICLCRCIQSVFNLIFLVAHPANFFLWNLSDRPFILTDGNRNSDLAVHAVACFAFVHWGLWACPRVTSFSSEFMVYIFFFVKKSDQVLKLWLRSSDGPGILKSGYLGFCVWGIYFFGGILSDREGAQVPPLTLCFLSLCVMLNADDRRYWQFSCGCFYADTLQSLLVHPKRECLTVLQAQESINK